MTRAEPGRVGSPCISVCVMDARVGLCAGCHRTLDEIAAWSVLDDDARRAVLAELPGRRRAAQERLRAAADGAPRG